MILVDTSVWVDHFRRRNADLAGLLDGGDVACHPFVVGELVLGSLGNRAQVLALFAELPAARLVGHDEVMALVEARALSGTGLGWVDVHLAASALIERWSLWTLDARLAAVAQKLNITWKGGAG